MSEFAFLVGCIYSLELPPGSRHGGTGCSGSPNFVFYSFLFLGGGLGRSLGLGLRCIRASAICGPACKQQTSSVLIWNILFQFAVIYMSTSVVM